MERKKPVFGFLDILITLLCLSVAAAGIHLFRNDLSRTLDSQNETPAGSITIKVNTVQRRLANRVLWDRLAVRSPVYPGDLIRVANLSAATLNLEDLELDLEENTLIRILRAQSGEGFRIELNEGSLGLASGEGSVIVNVMGREVQAAAGTALNVEAGSGGIKVQVSEGAAAIIGEGQYREVSAGTALVLNAAGTESSVRAQPAAAVTRPRSNARFLKSSAEPLSVNFAWNRINLEPTEALRLEIAADRNFTQVISRTETIETFARAALDTGWWNWRLLYNNTALAAGRFTITDASGPRTLSPVLNAIYRYRNEQPNLRFQWSAVEDASFYLVEVSGSPHFENLAINKQIGSVFFTDSSLGTGTWYWRVKPLFPSVYEGSSAYSPASSFRIEQSGTAEAPVIEVPQQIAAPAIAPPVPAPAPQPAPQPAERLPAPRSMQPATGYKIGVEELRSWKKIVFSWSAVSGANAYVFTLFHQTANGRREIIRTTQTQTTWTLDDRSLLSRGTFFWQVEAVNVVGGRIERHGTIGENSFVVDIPVPTIQTQESGILYGN